MYGKCSFGLTSWVLMFHIGQCLYHRNTVLGLEVSYFTFSPTYADNMAKKKKKKKGLEKKEKLHQNDHLVRFAVRSQAFAPFLQGIYPSKKLEKTRYAISRQPRLVLAFCIFARKGFNTALIFRYRLLSQINHRHLVANLLFMSLRKKSGA